MRNQSGFPSGLAWINDDPLAGVKSKTEPDVKAEEIKI